LMFLNTSYYLEVDVTLSWKIILGKSVETLRMTVTDTSEGCNQCSIVVLCVLDCSDNINPSLLLYSFFVEQICCILCKYLNTAALRIYPVRHIRHRLRSIS